MEKFFQKLKSYIPFEIKIFLLKMSFYLNMKTKRDILEAFSKQKEQGIHTIPIFIVSYNRLSYLKQLVKVLEERGYNNIYIIDNNSTYPPLIEYYKSIQHKVIYLEKNLGHMAFWKSSLFDKYRNDFYVVTDPDVIPLEECPNDFLELFFRILEKYPFVRKVGFSLKIDDLPVDNVFSNEVYNWEKQFYKNKWNNMYYASIDTTFALYLPDRFCKPGNFFRAFRISYPYMARHLPWYKKRTDVSEEDVYYSKHKTNGCWDVVNGFTRDLKK